MNKIKLPLLISISFLFLQIIVGANHSYISDPLVKFIQAKSMFESKWSSEEIIYPAKDLDPNAELQPLPEGFIFKHNNNIIGIFPIGTSFVYSIFMFLGANLLPFTNSIFIFLLAFYLQNIISTKNILLLIFGTVAFPQMFDFSENPIYIFLSCISTIEIYKFFIYQKKNHLLLSGLAAGFAVWFRLEILILYSIVFFISFIYLYNKNKNLEVLSSFIKAGLIFSFLVLSFFALNYFNYSHFLGPRFFGNYSGEFSISGKLTQMVTMIFSTVNNGVPSLGIFFISPFLFVPIIHSILNKDNYPNHILVFVYSTITFLLVASFIAPNNGITIAGRYLTAACFPMIIILEEFSQKSISKSLKITQRVLIAWAMIITLVSLATLAFSFKQVKRFEKQFASLDTDIWFFSTGFLSGSISLKYLDKKVMNINEKNVPKFESILKNNSINKFSILAPSVEFKKNLKLEEPSEQMLKVAKETNYNCKEISKSKELLRFDCERE